MHNSGHRRLEALHVDTEVLQPIVQAHRQDLVAPLADTLQCKKLPSVLVFLRLPRLEIVVPRGNLCGDLNICSLGNHLLGQRNAIHYVDTCSNYCFMLVLAHRQQFIDLFDSEPVEHVRHEFLSSRIDQTGNLLRHLEVHVWTVTTFLIPTKVVNPELCNLSEGSSFLPEVRDDTTAPFLGSFNCSLDGVDKVWTTGADIRSKHVRPVALVVRPSCYFALRIHNRLEVSK
mmetsp:Transcript_44547/g.172724  ORF Transcript_44547/g.172724 Transcript_44547/m.172724 type:complete len:230 (+) Transcript_44547:3230-3919(+)